MRQLLSIELYKIFKRPRTYISFLTVTAICALIQLALYTNGEEFMSFFLKGVTDQFEVSGNVLNGYLATYVILGLLLVHVPLLVALVAGDSLAGEAGAGTLRLLLTKPVSRTKIVIAKYLSTVVYSVALLLWLAIMGLLFSLLIFGDGDMMYGKSTEVVMLLSGDILWRYACAFLFAALAMATVSALSIFLSVFSENAIGPIVGTMGVIIVLTIVTNLDVPIFSGIQPYLFTTHMLGWKGFLSRPVPAAAVTKSVIVLVSYIVAFVGSTIIIFKKKDIQS